MNTYLTLKQKQQEEINNFPMVFAFNDSQFEEGMIKLGLTKNDTDKIYSIGGGGFIRKTDSELLNNISKRHAQEMQEAIKSDTKGDGFIFEMFNYELGNHEYSYTGDVIPTLEALSLTLEEVRNNPIMYKALQLAKTAQYENVS
jgi:hypothetical protein